MEKYNAYRDPGTGIQPFLNPVPPNTAPLTIRLLTPFAALFALCRTVLLAILALLYVVLTEIMALPLLIIPPLHNLVSRIITAILARVALILVGYWWIPVEVIGKQKGRTSVAKESWNPRAGDIIVSNWASWVELLWLAFRFNPIFVIPVAPRPIITKVDALSPGRRTGTGSAAISVPAITRTPLFGFKRVSLLQMLASVGQTPATDSHASTTDAIPLNTIRKKASRPIVVFPECTTSNGKGLLRFADIFDSSISLPVKGFNVFIMCVRYDLPTHSKPTATRPIPTALPYIPEPIPQLLSTTFQFSNVSIRLLAPSESPSSGSFLPSNFLTMGVTAADSQNDLSQICSHMVAQLGKLKRTGQGWEEKASFLDFYRSKK